MSICRWSGESDVYVYESTEGGYVCNSGANDSHEDEFRCQTPAEMLAHLVEHREAGHRVPGYAIDALSVEAAHQGDGGA